jgi:5-methylcytosine-specific restriction endonuclease McrA
MPSIPTRTICGQLGCKNPKTKFNAYCIDHGGKDKQTTHLNQTDERKRFNAMYQTRQWQALRKIQLSKQPLCAGCESEGVVTAATTVDHVFPWSRINKEAFFINKFQSLCETHHAHKTQMERVGIYRRFGKPNVDFKRIDYAYVMGLSDEQKEPLRIET